MIVGCAPVAEPTFATPRSSDVSCASSAPRPVPETCVEPNCTPFVTYVNVLVNGPGAVGTKRTWNEHDPPAPSVRFDVEHVELCTTNGATVAGGVKPMNE